jgi:hypothetical protein
LVGITEIKTHSLIRIETNSSTAELGSLLDIEVEMK